MQTCFVIIASNELNFRSPFLFLYPDSEPIQNVLLLK